MRPVSAPGDARLEGIDGLCWLGEALLAVQNHKGLNRVARLELDAQGEVERLTVLLEDHPHFRIPTTAVVVDGEAFLVANSQVDAYDEAGRLLAIERLANPVVLRFHALQKGG